jgi:glycosyltransferase family protein
MSIVRFGDGEFLYMIDKIDLPFQEYDKELADQMKEILRSTNKSLLVGLPSGYHSLDNLNREGVEFWKAQIAWIYPRLYPLLDSGKTYGNASMTRLYYEVIDKEQSKVHFQLVKTLWKDRHVLIVEGEKTRFGVGNDLLANAKDVQRILAPPHHAYRIIVPLLELVFKQNKNKLVLIALGPAAKVLTYRLSLAGFQAIDIGNLDIEYEWFLRGATEKVKIPGKYTSEAVGGRIVEDINDDLYYSQVIATIT